MRTLYTVGYEGRSILEFLAILDLAGIERLIDVRDRPISRKKGFSKNPLRNALAEVSIDYFHADQLGRVDEVMASSHRV